MDLQAYQQMGAGANAFPIPPSQYNPLDEPSPLGLRLKKSPSLLDLIQMRLSQGNHVLEVKCEDHGKGVMKDSQNSIACTVTADKMKASNFPGSVLKIGEWMVIYYSMFQRFPMLVEAEVYMLRYGFLKSLFLYLSV